MPLSRVEKRRRICYISLMRRSEALNDLPKLAAQAVAHYWRTRADQSRRQEQGGKADHGSRSAVTGGAHMDGFIDLFSRLVTESGVREEHIFRKKALELPGFFRPTKE